MCSVNVRPKDTTKKYCWLYLHCTYNYLRCWKGLASCSSDPCLSLPEAVWRKRVWDRRKGGREETSLAFHNPTVLCAQKLLFVTKASQKLLQKTITFYYPLHLLDLKQKYAIVKYNCWMTFFTWDRLRPSIEFSFKNCWPTIAARLHASCAYELPQGGRSDRSGSFFTRKSWIVH